MGSWAIPLKACPGLETPATPARPRYSGRCRILPSARLKASASQHSTISELNPHGLLPCCVRFAPTSCPVNGNTRYWSVCSTLTRRDLHPLGCIKRFLLTHFRFLLFQAFPNAIGTVVTKSVTKSRAYRLSHKSTTVAHNYPVCPSTDRDRRGYRFR